MNTRHSAPHQHSTTCCDDSAPDTTPPPIAQDGSAVSYRISTMDCLVEETEIRRALEPIQGIRHLGFYLSKRTLVINAPAEVQTLALAAIRSVGFAPQALPTPSNNNMAAQEHQPAGSDGLPEGSVRLMFALAFAFAAEFLAYFTPSVLAWQTAGMAIAAVGISLAGFDVYKKGIFALRQGKLNINALMSVAVSGAFLIGQWAEAAMVMALYAVAELIEARAVDRARHAIAGLLDLAPETAEVRQDDGHWEIKHATDIALGSTVRTKPGQRIALDGIVTSGHSTVNQAPITGESMPVEKAINDTVFAGTINESGSLEFTVTALTNDSTLARIIHAVEQAQVSRAPTQRFVDKFAAVYTPTVFIIALTVALAGPLLFDWTWLQAAYKALVLLVIACPCALVISTPVTVVSGLASAARLGILIKGGIYLEEARKLKAIALDKTGTITLGKPKLVLWDSLVLDALTITVDVIAASLAHRSDHPVSKAISAGLNVDLVDVASFQALPGRGVQGSINGTSYVLCNHRLIKERNQCSAELDNKLKQHEAAGHTVTLLANDTEVLALFAVADTIKASSQTAISNLKALGVTPVMLTGDNSTTAAAIGLLAGVDDIRGNLLPQDKLAAIQEMQQHYGVTGMVGDGINDAPALAQADIGFAMGGSGADIAMEAADIVIMNDNLNRIAATVALSRKTHAVLWQNISFAIGIKVIFFYLAIFYDATMWMAVFADMGASLLVVANGLRLLSYRPAGRT